MATLPYPDHPKVTKGWGPRAYLLIHSLNHFSPYFSLHCTTETPRYPFQTRTPRGVYKKLTIYFLGSATYYSTN